MFAHVSNTYTRSCRTARRAIWQQDLQCFARFSAVSVVRLLCFSCQQICIFWNAAQCNRTATLCLHSSHHWGDLASCKIAPGLLQLMSACQHCYCGDDPSTNTPVMPYLPAGALKKLTMHGNQLQQIAQEIGQLTNLQELHLQGNLLSELPNELCHLTVSSLHGLPRELCLQPQM